MVQTSEDFDPDDRLVIVTTAHSFKGHDAEVVFVVAADAFATSAGATLHSALYVAMTRARSLLYVSATRAAPGTAFQMIVDTLEAALDDLLEVPSTSDATGANEAQGDLRDAVGAEHHDWLAKLVALGDLRRDPIVGHQGELIADPLFTLHTEDGQLYACFGHDPVPRRKRHALEDLGYAVLALGDEPPNGD